MYFGIFYIFMALMLCPDVCGRNCVDSNHIVLTNTNETTITSSWFADYMRGKYLALSYNKINKIENTILWNIEVIEISFNEISSIDPAAFTGMGNTENNKLPEDFIYNKNSQTVADLSYNVFTHIPLSMLNSSMGEPREVILHDNLITAFEPWTYLRQGGQYFELRWSNTSTLTNNYNWTYVYRSLHDEAMTDLRYYNTQEWHDHYGQQNEKQIGLETAVMESRENPIVYCCNIHYFLNKMKQSLYQWSNSDYLNIMCCDPPDVKGKLTLNEVQNNAAFVSNISQYCPARCLYQDRQGTGVWNIVCGFPLTVRKFSYNNITTQPDNNIITTFDNVSFIPKLTYICISLNTIAKNLSTSFTRIVFVDVLYKISIMDNPMADVRNYSLTLHPLSLPDINNQDSYFQGNLSECSCGQLWMVNFINIARNCTNTTPTCEYEGKNYTIIELQTMLKCHPVGSVVLNTVLFAVLVIVIVLLVTAIKCPYETKVLLFKIFRIHPSDTYQVDKTMDKPYDMYVSFDDDDPYVRQWVIKVLFKQLERKKPFYRMCVAARDAPAGPEADVRLQLIEDSRRLLIILSENYEKHKWCEYEMCHSETLEHNQGRILYLLYDKTAEDNAKQEPWLSKMRDRKVFRLWEKMLWSKLRYEMPRKPLPEKQ